MRRVIELWIEADGFLGHFQRFSKVSMTFPLLSLFARRFPLDLRSTARAEIWRELFFAISRSKILKRKREKERQDLRKDDDVFPCSFYGERRIVRLEAINPARSPANPAVTIRNVFLGETGSLLRTNCVCLERIRFKRDTLAYVHRS